MATASGRKGPDDVDNPPMDDADLFVVGPNPEAGNTAAVNRAAYTWQGFDPSDIPPPPTLDYATQIVSVLKAVHPNLTIGKEGLLTLEDMIHHILRRIATNLPLTSPRQRCAGELDPPNKDSAIKSECILGGETFYLIVNEAEGEFCEWVPASTLPSSWQAVQATWAEVDDSKREQLLAAFVEGIEDEDLDHVNGFNITSRCIQTAMRSLFPPGDLVRNAMREATKAVIKVSCQRAPFTSWTEIVVFPVAITAVTAKIYAGRPLCKFAAVYLSAVLESLTTRILELSGNVAGDINSPVISNHCIRLGVKLDPELNVLYPHQILGGGSGKPAAPKAFDPTKYMVDELGAAPAALQMIGATDSQHMEDNSDWTRDGSVRRLSYEHPYEHPFLLGTPDKAVVKNLALFDAECGLWDVLVGDPPLRVEARAGGFIVLDGIMGITNEHLKLLAARAGTVALELECFETLRATVRDFVARVTRTILTRVEHRKRREVNLTDVAASLCYPSLEECLVFGSGRLSDVFKSRASQSGSTEPSDFESEQEATAMAERATVNVNLPEVLSDVVHREAEAQGDEEEDAEERYNPAAALAADDAEGAFINSLRLIKAVSRYSGPILPFTPFATLVFELGNDFKTGVRYGPAGLRLLCEACEAHVVRVIERADELADHRGSGVVSVNDIALACKTLSTSML